MSEKITSKINVLDKHIAELIAAGEVIERPASVIKELVENSVDCGASSIVVEIKDGGITYMRVTDNGCGILRDDAPKAFLRHATSKVKTQNDLDEINTLGFRGEALASISAVSNVELITRTGDEIEGTRYRISASDEVLLESAGCEIGSTFIVRDLFFNVPARMKFLKKAVAEGNSVSGIIDRMALSHPEIAFKFIRDGKTVLITLGNNDLKSCIFSVYGKSFCEGLLPVSYELNGVNVSGYIGNPEASRPNRNMQHFFVNGRYVKIKTGMVALEEAYKGVIMVGKHPSCVLFIEIPAQVVDVNVHPAKTEVRFVNERPIFDCIYHAVKSSLLKRGESRKEDAVKFSTDSPQIEMKREEPVFSCNDNTQGVLNDVKTYEYTKSETQKDVSITPKQTVNCILDEEEPEVFIPKKSSGYSLNSNSYTVHITPSSPNTFATQKSTEPLVIEQEAPEKSLEKEEPIQLFFSNEHNNTSFRAVAEVFNTYVIAESDDNLIFIDKHALHEMMIYNELKSKLCKVDSQLLISPVTIVLEKTEYTAVLENVDILQDAGFLVEDFGQGFVIVREIPTFVDACDVEGLILEMAEYLIDNKKDITASKIDWLYKNIACRAAIKAGKSSKESEIADIVKKWEQNPNITNCPHGRPVSIVISKKDIEKRFKRI